MDTELRELYQEIILDHNRNPKNFSRLEQPTHTAEGYNPLCGDRITVYLDIKDDRIEAITFQGSGCAISKASASVMTTLLKGKTPAEARQLFKRFQQLITAESGDLPDIIDLGKLAVFAGVREYPSRVKCAALAWHTVIAALENPGDVVTTE